MKNVLSNVHISRQAMFYMFVAVVLILMVLHPQVAFASDADTSATKLPFTAPLKAISDTLTGPVAMAVSLIGIVGAGAMLIFGGDMSGFLRTLIFLVLVISLIVSASSVIKLINSDAAVIAAAIDHARIMSRSMFPGADVG